MELVVARREAGDFDEAVARRWAAHLGRDEELGRVLALADQLVSP